jgi:phosphohistidine phosphatase
MKRLYLSRHAKSSWDDAALTDFERPLNKRGHRDAPFIGKLLREQGHVPDIIISSPANRALTTARIFAEEMDYPFDDIIINEELYETGVSDYLQVIATIDDRHPSAMLVGHNPTLTSLAGFLSDARVDNIPTCGVVVIQFENDSWADIIKRNGACEGIEYPKKYFTS